MSTIIECPACSTRYKMNKPIPEGGRSVKCARCGHQWRMVPEEPEELIEEVELEDGVEAGGSQQTAAAEAQAASSWELRRGQFAAAIGALGDRAEAADAPGREEGVAAADRWASDWSRNQLHDSGEGQAQDDSPSGASATDAAGEDGADYGASAGGQGLAWTDDGWTQGSQADKDASAFDPEFSVREALKAALEDPEPDEKTRGSRPAFDEAFDRTFGDVGSPEGRRADASYEDEAASGANEAAPADLSFLAAGSGYRAESVNGEAQDEDDIGRDRFESDIAGRFSPRDQQKRGFSRAAAPPRHEDGFTDYDAEAGGQADDDRYMADSPLDADAAALQAAIEGSLRETQGEERRGGGLALAAAWAVFISVLSGVALAFVTFRDDIVTALPGTGALYETLGFDVQGRQIDFGAVSYRWTVSDGKPMIEVTGQIINLTDREITVPRVLINVRDSQNAEPVKATATLRTEPLAASETADFTLEFLSPPKTISQIELAFAEGSGP